jgi:hypothetical protein
MGAAVAALLQGSSCRAPWQEAESGLIVCQRSSPAICSWLAPGLCCVLCALTRLLKRAAHGACAESSMPAGATWQYCVERCRVQWLDVGWLLGWHLWRGWYVCCVAVRGGRGTNAQSVPLNGSSLCPCTGHTLHSEATWGAWPCVAMCIDLLHAPLSYCWYSSSCSCCWQRCWYMPADSCSQWCLSNKDRTVEGAPVRGCAGTSRLKHADRCQR